MIVQPEFPKSFQKFLSTILTLELETDRMKSQIDPNSAEQLFKQIDSMQAGSIYLQDIYTFLKKNGLSVSKRQLKFLNKYFGFSYQECLSIQLFRKYFLLVRNPKNTASVFQSSNSQLFIKYIAYVLESYLKIEQIRMETANDIESLNLCIQKYFPNKNGVLTKEVIKECLYDLKLYSRLNSSLIFNYVIGESNNQISLKQLFWKENLLLKTPEQQNLGNMADQQLPIQIPIKTAEFKEEKTQINSQNLVKQKSSPYTPLIKMNYQSNDILSQIQNIEATIKQRKEMYAQKKRDIQQQQQTKSKIVGTLVKRSSGKSRDSKKNYKISSNISRFAEQAKGTEQKQLMQQFMIPNMKENLAKIEISQRYVYQLQALDEDDKKMNEINEMIRNRFPSKTKQQVLNKASSCAQLKIQQIEKRVMGKIHSKAATSKVSDYTLRPYELRHNMSGQIRSRYSSIRRP